MTLFIFGLFIFFVVIRGYRTDMIIPMNTTSKDISNGKESLFQAINATNQVFYSHESWDKNEKNSLRNAGLYERLKFCDGMHYVVSIRLGRTMSIYNSKHICGGVPISSYMVISAATCFFRTPRVVLRPRQIFVLVGCQNRFEQDPNTVGLRVRDIFLQVRYLRKPEGDVAILVLKDPIPLTPYIPIVPLASTFPAEGSDCFTLGWGRIFFGGPLVDDLTATNYTIIHNGACGAIFPYIVGQNLICGYKVGEKKRAICEEDAGGPLICNGTLYGIISGFSDCSEDRMNFFTPMASHYQWIIMLNTQDDSKLILSAMVLFAVFSILVLINKHRIC